MGNCITHESKMQWGGEDWSPTVASEREIMGEEGEDEDERLYVKKSSPFSTETATVKATKTTETKTTEVKIRITKKQLEELIGKVDVKGLSTEKVLAELMAVCAEFETTQQIRSWRPRLQSIPEA
ncbi:hypothetical protein Nepgr_027349 [Nepenthes gracilis]|uniref:Uncharacterized protein n=1 Tax=Nepenthes gracilis TaxID=150966 RepID=A0AAD3TB78_NEPGR|nr:hypothetical protein Nepgr_027349 [Nepenthes gracilis]